MIRCTLRQSFAASQFPHLLGRPCAGLILALGFTAAFPSYANDAIAPSVVIGGTEISTAAPPPSLVLHAGLGVITARGIEGQIIAHARYPKRGLFETRCVIAPNGDYVLMYPDGGHYGSASTKVNDLLEYRSTDHGQTWQGPQIAFDIDYNQHGFIPFIPKGSQRIYAFGTQPIWGLYTRERGLNEDAPIGYRYSDDNGHHWSEVRLIHPVNDPDYRGMSVMRMTETANGTWLLGTHEADWSYKPLMTRSYVLRSTDQGRTWELLPGPRHGGWYQRAYNRMDEVRPIALEGSNVLLMARTPEGHLWELRSSDDGKTWSPPEATSLVQPDAPPMIFKLSDHKTLICFFHNRFHGKNYTGLNGKDPSMADRSEIWFATSTDGGQTWSTPRFVFANALMPTSGNPFRDYNCSYLDMIEDGGVIHLFVPHRWERVLHLHFQETELSSFPTAEQLTSTTGAKS